jgi:hypothetical protein
VKRSARHSGPYANGRVFYCVRACMDFLQTAPWETSRSWPVTTKFELETIIFDVIHGSTTELGAVSLRASLFLASSSDRQSGSQITPNCIMNNYIKINCLQV